MSFISQSALCRWDRTHLRLERPVFMLRIQNTWCWIITASATAQWNICLLTHALSSQPPSQALQNTSGGQLKSKSSTPNKFFWQALKLSRTCQCLCTLAFVCLRLHSKISSRGACEYYRRAMSGCVDDWCVRNNADIRGFATLDRHLKCLKSFLKRSYRVRKKKLLWFPLFTSYFLTCFSYCFLIFFLSLLFPLTLFILLCLLSCLIPPFLFLCFL